MDQLMSWLQSRHHRFPLGGTFSIGKTSQEWASDTFIYVLQGGTKDSVTLEG